MKVRVEIITAQQLEAMLKKTGWTPELLQAVLPEACIVCGARWSCTHCQEQTVMH